MAKYLIGASNIKYDVLDNIFKDVKISNDILNFYIDSDYVFHRLYRNAVMSDLFSVDKNTLIMDIVITMVNMIGHYRRYFVTRLHKDNRIFILFNTKVPAYQKHCYSDYGSEYYKKYDKSNKDYSELTDIIKTAYKFMQSILVYFEGVYCINNAGIENLTVIKFLQNNDNTEGDYHLIFTRNHLACQLIDSNCSVLYTKRDHSYIATIKDCYKGILEGKKTNSGDLTPSTIPYCFALCGYRERDIEPTLCKGVVSAVKKLKKLWNSGNLNNNTSIPSFVESLESEIITDDIKHISEALTINLSEHAMTSDQKEMIMSSIYDLYDQEGIEAINEMLINLNSDGDIIESGNLNMCINDKYYSSYFDDLSEWSI